MFFLLRRSWKYDKVSYKYYLRYLNRDGVIKAINNSEKYMIIDIFNISKGYILELGKNIKDFENQE